MIKCLIVACVAFAPVMAMAQQPPTPVPPPLAEYTLKVTAPELDIISDGLQSQPFGKVSPLIAKLRQQIIDQQKVVEKKPEDNK